MSSYTEASNIGALDRVPGGSAASRFGYLLENCLKWSTELLAAILVVAEIVLLLANVTYRYALHDPLTWGDELASLLFIWLAMIGAVIALRRSEHMRLTTFLARMAPRRQIFFETFGNVVVLAFMVLLIGPAWEHTHEEWAITTPALEIKNAFRVGAILVGVVLMMLIVASRLMEKAKLKDFVISTAILIGFAAVLLVGKPVIMQLGNYSLVFFFVICVSFLVAIAVPIMVAFGISTVAYLVRPEEF